jgi:hypothetical protein
MRYLIVRALLFLVPFAVLMIAQVPWWLSMIVAIVFAFAASIVFFSQLRDAAAADVQRMREGRKRAGAGPDDADIEDAALGEREDAAEAEAPAADEREAPADGADPRSTAQPEHAAQPEAPPADERDATADGADPDASARP